MAPKSFSDQEREAIDLRLRQSAADCLARYGVRKTTVDELVRLANIPKGTFYLFYPSKEVLFFRVFTAYHDELQGKFLSRLAAAGFAPGWEDFSNALLALCREAEESFILSLVADGGLDLIMRKLPPEEVAGHQAQDDGSVEQMFTRFPQFQYKDPEVYSAALRGIFLLYNHRREIGEDVFDKALEAMVRGLCRQMFSEDTI